MLECLWCALCSALVAVLGLLLCKHPWTQKVVLLHACVSYLLAFKEENSRAPAATRHLKPVTKRSSWQLVFNRNKQDMPSGAPRGGGLAPSCVVGGRNKALDLGALAPGDAGLLLCSHFWESSLQKPS